MGSVNSVEVNVFDLLQAVAMGFASAYLLGSTNGANFLPDVEFCRHWLEECRIFNLQMPLSRADFEVEKWYFLMCEAAKAFIHSEEALKNELATEPVV